MRMQVVVRVSKTCLTNMQNIVIIKDLQLQGYKDVCMYGGRLVCRLVCPQLRF